MIIPVYVRDRLYLPRSPEFLDLLEELRHYFTYKNPNYGKMKAMGKYTGNIPMELTSWMNRTVDDLGECLALPRGGTKKLREVFDKHNYTPRFVDQRLSLAPITGYHNNVVLRPDQERLARAMFKHENCLIRSPTASGKCLAPDTLVILYTLKRKRADEVVVGDQLLGPDFKPRNVLSTSRGHGSMYMIKPFNGKPWFCNSEHILTLAYAPTKELIDIPLNIYLIQSEDFKRTHPLCRLHSDGNRMVGFVIERAGKGDYVGWTLDGDGRFLLDDATITHNTETALKVVEWMLEKSGPVLIIVWDSALLYQWVERTALRFGLRESEIGIIGDGKKQVKDITIGMQQTLRRHIGKYSHSFGAVIADEVQRFAAATFQYVIDRFPAKYRIGISASEQRRDGTEFLIYDAFGSVADEIQRSTLIDNGKIMDVDVKIIPTEFDYVIKMGNDYVSWNEIDAKHKDYNDLITVSSHDEDRNNLIWKFMEPVLKTGKISLVVSQRVAHAKYWESRIRAAGYATGLMLGGTENSNEFEATLNGLRSKKVQVGIGTIQKSGTAHDIPTLERAFVLTPLASNKQLFEQLVGRLRRNSPGKTDAVCYYFWDSTCFPFHLTSIRRMYKENTYLWVDKEFLPQ